MNASSMEKVRERLNSAMGFMRPAELARRTGVSSTTVGRYLKDRDLKLDFVMACCQVLNVSPNWLLWGSESKPVTAEELRTKLIEFLKAVCEWVEPGSSDWLVCGEGGKTSEAGIGSSPSPISSPASSSQPRERKESA
jgi:transcriptional regulator with XRE-family HTH domain